MQATGELLPQLPAGHIGFSALTFADGAPASMLLGAPRSLLGALAPTLLGALGAGALATAVLTLPRARVNALSSHPPPIAAIPTSAEIADVERARMPPEYAHGG